MANSKVEKWQRWCEKRIYPDVLVMHLYRDTFNGVGRIVGESDLPPSYFWKYLPETYSTTQAVAVGRQQRAGCGPATSAGCCMRSPRSPTA